MAADALDPLRGIMLKVFSVVVFVMMQTSIKSAGPDIPAGQITFYRSAFALVPILAYLASRHELRQAFRTNSPFGHLKRGTFGIMAMALGFYGLVHLPMPDAIAIGYSMPLIAVVFAAVILKEKVRLYRWTAVAVGMVGVVIITWPKLTLFNSAGVGSGQALGAAAVLMSAVMGGFAMVQVRQLADVSTVAPFEYTSILLGIAVAYALFGDIPSVSTLVGTAITVSAGIFIIYREHQLGLERKAARKASPPSGAS
eukprot:g20073.t1